MEVSAQVNKPSTSTNVGGMNDDCYLVLEPSKDDPLYEKKMSLLNDNDCCPCGRVYVRDTSRPNAVKVLLYKLLERAEIIHLDDMELYFGLMKLKEIEFELFSPRNELEALNTILSQIDLCSEKSNSNHAFFKALRDAVVKRIHHLGEINRFKTKIVKEPSECENEMNLMQWAQSCGVKSKLQIAYVEGAGRGALAAEDLEVGDVALEIPTSAIISEDLVNESDMFHILDTIEGISAETKMLLWSMRERHNSDSKYKLYFDTLPEQFNTGLSFSVHAMIALDETLASEEIFQAKEHLRSQYDQLFPALSTSYPDLFPPDFYKWEQFLWACELWYSNSMKILFPDGKLRTCLIPVAGFLNHSVCPHILHYGRVDSEANTLKFHLARPCKKGEQCYLSYGTLSSAHLLTFYGFLPQETNPYDVIPLEFEANTDCSSEESNTTHMVRGTWLSAIQDIFCYGLPLPLLEHLRKARNPGLRTMTLSQENLENEITVLDNLHDIFHGMLEKLGDSAKDDRKSEEWDVQLAIEYKDLQRTIASSVVVACISGRKTVEDALNRRTAEDSRG